MSVVRLGNPGTDRKAKPGSFLSVGARIVGSKEAVEDLFARILGNTDAMIANGEAGELAVHAELDFHCAVRIGIFHSIVDNVQNQFAKTEFIPLDRCRLNGLNYHVHGSLMVKETGLALDIL
jgi:hypothetical protein